MNDILGSSVESCKQVHVLFECHFCGTFFAKGRQVDNALRVTPQLAGDVPIISDLKPQPSIGDTVVRTGHLSLILVKLGIEFNPYSGRLLES